MKYKTFSFLLLILFIALVCITDRFLWKLNHGFSVHIIEAPIPPLEENSSSLPFPKSALQQPFYYLSKGSQCFVFESKDHSIVIKFYRFPSHMRRFPWSHHPLGYLFSKHRKKIQDYNIKKFKLTMHSFLLAEKKLSHQTGVIYTHLQPTHHINHSIQIIDSLGYSYQIPLDPVVFVIQRKGACFLSLFKDRLRANDIVSCKQMILSLIELLKQRCLKGISDLDHMDNGNYGWLEERAIHLDIGRFQEETELEKAENIQKEMERITAPVGHLLMDTNPTLYQYYLDLIEQVNPAI
jgi:hypothetical protein